MFERRTNDQRSNPKSPFSCLFLLLDWMMFPFVFIRVHSWFNCIVTAREGILYLRAAEVPSRKRGARRAGCVVSRAKRWDSPNHAEFPHGLIRMRTASFVRSPAS